MTKGDLIQKIKNIAKNKFSGNSTEDIKIDSPSVVSLDTSRFPVLTKFPTLKDTIVKLLTDQYELFLKDMGPRKPGMTIDRIDTNGQYCPDNCKWSTQEEQQNHRRNNVLLNLDGDILTMAQAARKIGVSHGSLSMRRTRGTLWKIGIVHIDSALKEQSHD